jgi:hypothetical protein
MKRPRSFIRWLPSRSLAGLLRALVRGEVPLTYEGVHSLPPLRSRIYNRDLMITTGILPSVDKFRFLFE